MGYGELDELLDVCAADRAELCARISHRVAVGAEAGRRGRARLRHGRWLSGLLHRLHWRRGLCGSLLRLRRVRLVLWLWLRIRLWLWRRSLRCGVGSAWPTRRNRWRISGDRSR